MYTQVFMGFKVPELCYDNEAFKGVVELFNSAKGTYSWCEGADGIPNRGCAGVTCSDCILCDNAGSTPAELKRQAFAAYLHNRGFPVTRPGYETPKEKEKESMPELKTGMLIQLDTSVYIICINQNYGYRVVLRDDSVVLSSLWKILPEHISEVWYSKLDPGCPLSVSDIQFILLNEGMPRRLSDITSWVKPEPAKKMTVDEVSKALGYKVEIIDETHVDLGVKGFADRV